MSQEQGIAYCEQLFAPWLDGHKLISNASHLRGAAIWIRFPRVICDTWVHWNTLDTARGARRVPVVLMGDAAHTAHFSVGRSEEHTSELQSLMRISYAVFCLNKTRKPYQYSQHNTSTKHCKTS